ncbi:uncharacterized protein CANTADRAFT_52412 [Suhomyces tanzawaensis NRRL Y-17324]|uniref:Transcription initiation factor IIA large subunit n=1 Tax=Suhomyces tanzawaensis NRRL Y-17324 TaxID=984487 RepID=A0A1E4SFV3_9ASCO|nr:uncharacterized protein CANTADRAFT_52412 [Suhomyces tanzawaensis NRRL Y-17324]ODV78391.1 hypothetical protein CANTADRAFT_52412 [Suhomyces tanzawaensis NRRL Y-17324]
MSNKEAIKLYETVIEEVISDSRQDFENNGIDESTLQDLRRIWCEKLSQSQVAKFSWDEEESYEGPNSLAAHARTTGAGLELPNVASGNELSYGAVATGTNNIGIELPHIQSDEEDHGTGLMLPNINQADGTFEMTVYTDKAPEFIESLKAGKKIKQADGTLDDDDDDEGIFNDSDDINSDLDDGLESEKLDDEDGDQEGQIMLCLYEKVQRIKNKWKSTLKEGVANINGRDYVFQKATGECEW